MKPSRMLAGAALLFAATSLGWLSCSGKQSANSSAPDAAAETEGGGAGGGGGNAGTTAGGNGGGLDAGEWGASPDWEPTTLVAAGCPIERLANAPQVRVFRWKPCSWSPNDCEEAEFNTDLVGAEPNYVGRASAVRDDGATVRVGLKFESPDYQGLFANENGAGLVGIRPALSTSCGIGSASVWGSRFGVRLYRLLSQVSAQYGGVLGDLNAPGNPSAAFTLDSTPEFGIAQTCRLGASRWVWQWAEYGYSAVSAIDGSGYKEFVTIHSPGNFVYLGPPITIGNTFLFDAVVGDDAGMAHSKIFYSDGIAAPQVYLEPTEPDTYYGSPIYANSYVAFFKGIGFQDVNKYNSVELWASPYSDDPTQLKPVKLADLARKHMPIEPIGGWGYALFAGTSMKDAVHVWDLAHGTEQVHGMPATYAPIALLGVSRKYAWVSGSKPGGYGPYLFRMRLQ